MAKKTVIIGGVAGGATTAARLRRRDENMQIVMLERGGYISYANCGLPYYIGDVIKSRDALLLQTPEAMKAKFDIDVRIMSEVTRILPEEKAVEVKNLKTGEIYRESYDNLVLATGSSPVKPPIPGIDGENIFTLWSVPDTDRIKSYITEKKPRRAAVIGGGFIGLEMAENLHEQGLDVAVIEMQNQVMAPLDADMANLLHENLRMNGIELILGDGVKEFHQAEGKTRLELTSGAVVETDMVILSIGVRPNSELAAQAGATLNKRGGIQVDAYFRTSLPDVYAVGDVIEVDHFVTKEKTMIPLAGPANKQARILADHLAGDQKTYNGTLGTSVAKVFDLHAASVGLNEKQLKTLGKVKNQDYFIALINQKSHAGYYPGAVPLTLKMLFDKDGKIFGGQVVGQDGVDKRIDTLATVMRLNGTIYDLEELELAYAPPFSSAKDPVNMLGFTAENILRQMVRFMECDELEAMLADPEKKETYTILDVTEEMERMVYSIPGSYHIPLGKLRERMEELDREKLIIPYCAIGVRSYNAARILSQNGFGNVAVLAGGTAFYKSMHWEDADVFHSGDKPEDGAQSAQKQKEEEPSEAGQEKMWKEGAISDKELRVLDCCGLQCPGPIMKVHEAISEMKENEVLKVCATDMGFAADIGSWCRRTGNTLVRTERVDKENIVYIRKGSDCCTAGGVRNDAENVSCCGVGEMNQKGTQVCGTQGNQMSTELPQGKTIIVFSGDLDKVLASFIIANGAAAMGRPVTMFFTFWGLNALRKSDGPSVKKPFMEKMFGAMMPKGSRKLKLSKMNMAGMGTAMMKKVMKDKNVDSLESLMQYARKSGIRLVACTMSMDIMGITKEELIDGVEFAGVASYLGDAEESNVNLFV
ncbi:FAD-dependent oxidoreductase [Faecalicatena sp. AGMB00832]|uniref:FAD-dependent oxidoreductase n=1 Tax=Faecalicatena faecalis TaxID=2726362 RepID=A0ABS6DB52_9FIRM|nr:MULTISPECIES: DsrE/DsrF/DrsH-like family protein [Faecalicatena]MBU3878336.1 FAD-dependent oxidoreductase [Faecalicatena faecalis]MCI6466703.1 FAD-dependent oxidoreductase [Faecalicatena sp.]MDY5620677.1 FAD-dependent oxidoreductase [Lachnospiraceae bacterium]